MINLDSLPPSAHNLDLGPILARAEAASDAYFDHLAPRCSYTSAGDGMGCGLSSGHDGPHVMLIPRADGWRYVNEARTDIPALCAEVARLRAALSWQESRHGTQAEQEREEAETAAELEAIDAMSEEQVAAELREAGIDVEAGRETCEALVRVALERNRLRAVAQAAIARANAAEARCDALEERLTTADVPWRVPGCQCPSDSKPGDRCDARWSRRNARLNYLRALKATENP